MNRRELFGAVAAAVGLPPAAAAAAQRGYTVPELVFLASDWHEPLGREHFAFGRWIGVFARPRSPEDSWFDPEIRVGRVIRARFSGRGGPLDVILSLTLLMPDGRRWEVPRLAALLPLREATDEDAEEARLWHP